VRVSVKHRNTALWDQNNFGKLLTSILTSKVEKWFDDNNMSSDAQFGFRKGLRTVDAIFVLHNLVQHITDFRALLSILKKAFDSVYRNALWYKLFKMGLDGKILKYSKLCIQM
jgi:hypothetical protein